MSEIPEYPSSADVNFSNKDLVVQPIPGVASPEITRPPEGQSPELLQGVTDSIGAFSLELAKQLGIPPERLAQAFIDAVQRELRAPTTPESAEVPASLTGPDDELVAEAQAEHGVERQRAVERILATPGISMALYGKFDKSGVVSGETVAGYYDDTLEQAHWAANGRDVAMEPRGHQNMPFYWGRRAPVQTEGEKFLPPFEGVVVEKASSDVQGSPVAFSLTYVDTGSNDRRPHITTTCTVVLPQGAYDTIDTIRGDSSLMIELMRRAFPEADRSQGELRITEDSKKGHILKATVDRQGNLTLV